MFCRIATDPIYLGIKIEEEYSIIEYIQVCVWVKIVVERQKNNDNMAFFAEIYFEIKNEPRVRIFAKI